jgi:hypothetical protein
MTEATKVTKVTGVTEPRPAWQWPAIRRQCERLRPAFRCEYPWRCKCELAELELPPDTRTEGTPLERIERAAR